MIIMDYGVTLRCHVKSQNDVMLSSDIIKITPVARKDCKIYNAGGCERSGVFILNVTMNSILALEATYTCTCKLSFRLIFKIKTLIQIDLPGCMYNANEKHRILSSEWCKKNCECNTKKYLHFAKNGRTRIFFSDRVLV